MLNGAAMTGEFRGDVAPQDAWWGLVADAGAVLLDVRTQPEWLFVGTPDLTGLARPLVTVSWQVFPTMARNPNFAADVEGKGITRDRPVYLICRSGVRSRAAAEFLAEQGFVTFNVADGFEGQLDDAKHRGNGGWRASGLPWRQS